jgi:hypothetical protein
MTHHNQTKELTTWFLNLPLDESIGNKNASMKFESMTHEAQLEDKKPMKSLKRSSRRGKTAKASKWHEKRQSQAK